MTLSPSRTLSVSAAQELIQQHVTPTGGSDLVSLHQALGRVLAQDILSPFDVPPHDNSAMDGYALRSADLHGDETCLQVRGLILAGQVFDAEIQVGECIKIMTGAVMPAGCDSVIPIELVGSNEHDVIRFRTNTIKPGDNRRLRGEDLSQASIALAKGKIVRPADLGLLASLGIAAVPVQRKLRVAFFSTGNEIASIGEPLAAGQLYDSNRYTLFGMLSRLGCEPIDMGVIKDEPTALEQAFHDACANADAVITSGGVSAGDADFTRQMLERLGEVAFWQIAMRPGRPLAFGRIQSGQHTSTWFGLPGNPVAVMVSFYFFARLGLLRMMGAAAPTTTLVPAIMQTALRKRQGRTEFQRGIVSSNAQGQLHVSLTGAQGSGILRSMSEANCIIVLDDAATDVAAGDVVQIILFEGLI